MDNNLHLLWEQARGNPIQFERGVWVDLRCRLAEKYSWAVPNNAALETISEFSPIIEMGAGLGYWAHLLQEQGVDILPFDIEPPEESGETSWTPVLKGSFEQIPLHKDRTLFFCWPPHSKKLFDRCLDLYTGEYLLWVGEDNHKDLGINHLFVIEEVINIPRWQGFEDRLLVYKRRP